MLRVMCLALCIFTQFAIVDAATHDLDPYDPVAIWTMDQGSESDVLTDKSGTLKAVIYGDRRIAKHIDGAFFKFRLQFPRGEYNSLRILLLKG